MTASLASNFTIPTPQDFSIYEVFLDLAHPASVSDPFGPKIIRPKPSPQRRRGNLDVSELYDSENISKITRFAFPEHDDRVHGKCTWF